MKAETVERDREEHTEMAKRGRQRNERLKRTERWEDTEQTQAERYRGGEERLRETGIQGKGLTETPQDRDP